jgi:hypothetical protein
MAANLFTPILNDRTRSVHFFNGRLLTGEDLTSEQRGQRAVHELLGESIGEGIVRGLEVKIDDSNTVATPVVSVTGGVAINRQGDPLYLSSDTKVQLVRSTDAQPATATIFSACTPPESGVYVAGAGVYLLTMCTTVVGDGSAPVSGLGGQPSGCNSRYEVDAVQFRLLELPISDDDLAHPNLLRNRVAYQCFGVDGLSSFSKDPFGTTTEPSTLLDQLRPRSLTDCDVPLATLYWTASGGVVWLDMWSVRRRVAQKIGAAGLPFVLADRALARAEAMRAQFQDQLEFNISPFVRANTSMRYLPPAAVIPTADSLNGGFDYTLFFDQKTYNEPVFIEGGMVEPLLRISAQYPPVDLQNPEMVWLYWVRENMQAAQTGGGVQTALIFANADLPFFGEPRFDRSHWNYSNYI